MKQTEKCQINPGETANERSCCGHNHADIGQTTGKRLLITMALNLLIPILQIIGGIQAQSMALISDAAHNFSDFTALLIAWVASRVARKGASARNTFGYRRAEILAAAVNVGLLVGVSGFIMYEAWHRLHNPTSVSGGIVVVMAMAGVVGNGISVILLHRDSKHNLNVRGAFLHMIGDLLTSVVVGLSGIVLMFRPWYWLDPILSVVIAVFILRNCWLILKEVTAILMDATPGNLDILELKEFLERLPGVDGAHYLHAWNVCSSSIAFSCHLVVPDQNLSKVDVLASHVKDALLERFGIDHPVLQFETTPCGSATMLCGMSCGFPGVPCE